MKIVMVLEFGQLSYTACYLCLQCIIITITPRFVYMWFVNLNISMEGHVVNVSFWWSVVPDCLGYEAYELHLCCCLLM